MNALIVIYVKVFLICILWGKSFYICLNIKTNKMELGTKYKFKEGSIGTLIEKNKNYGLFKFEDGSQFVFNLNKLKK